MKDSFGREIEYMRVSVTDRCNLRCRYCMPKGIELLAKNEILSFEEILRVCRQAALLGIDRIKITGGEPLVRKGIEHLIADLKKIPGISQVTMTTNGILLKEHLDDLVSAGIDGVNISLDTLKADRYEMITGSNNLLKVTDSIDACLSAGIRLKINSVIMKGINDDEITSLASLARDNALDVRFIEMMPIGFGRDYQPVSGSDILHVIESKFGKVKADDTFHGNGPAKYVKPEGFTGSIGFISAMHGKFCSECNRVRLTSTGKLKSCLCYDDAVDLRQVLRSDEGSDEKLTDLLKEGIIAKPSGHCFEDVDKVTEKKKMISIGG